MREDKTTTPYARRTLLTILFSEVCNEPFNVLYALLPFILLKAKGATAFQIVLLTMLRPLAGIFSLYWCSLLRNKHSLKINLLGAGCLAYIPFLWAIWADNIYGLIAAAFSYALFQRASIPAWMEILNSNLPKSKLQKFFTAGSATGYAMGVLIAVVVGPMLDVDVGLWKGLYAASIGLSLVKVGLQVLLPMAKPSKIEEVKGECPTYSHFWQPWVDSWRLMQKAPEFFRFQCTFMLGGLGLMVLQPALPIFYDTVLHLSYKDLMIALTLCKGLGFVLSAPIWGRFMSYLSLRQFLSLVLLGFGLFGGCLIACYAHSFWIYCAYCVYGIAQGGSHLIWHLSGPLFAKGGRSDPFSSVNVVMVGVRGLVGPPLGGLFCNVCGMGFVLCLNLGLCALAIMSLYNLRVPTRLKQEAS